MDVEVHNRISHVVLIPFPAQGHIPPMVYLARKLAANGIMVTLINVDGIHEMLLKQWIRSPGAEIRLEKVCCELNIPAGVDATSIVDAKQLLEALNKLEGPVEKLVRELKPYPRCIVADYFLGWPLSMARSLRMTPAIYWPGNVAWSSLHHHIDLLIANKDILRGKQAAVIPLMLMIFRADDCLEDKIISYIPGAPVLQQKELPSYFRRKPDEACHRLLFDFKHDRMKECEWILVNSMVELEAQAFEAMQRVLSNSRFLAVGPLFPVSDNATLSNTSLRDEDKDCLQWLDTQAEHSVLYISFGSISVLSESTFQEIARGLEASKQPFLWVNRQDLVQSSISHDEFYRGFLERTQRRGRVVSWAPQLRVLAHPSVGGFLSHCGWNSALESICSGVPVLGWPCHSEQALNCKLVTENWKLGKKLSQDDTVSHCGVEQGIKDFMNGRDSEAIRLRVRAFQNVARATATHGGASHESLKAFVEAVVTMCVPGNSVPNADDPFTANK